MNAIEPKVDTKQRILDSAERLFADRGFEATSLRTIIAEAGVNLAAVHYHYHSKDALLDSVLMRRLNPVNSERLRMLDACERAAGEGPVSLESVLEAFLGPPFRLGSDPQSKTFLRLMGRLMSDNTAVFRHLVETHFLVIIQRFSRALQNAAPELPMHEIMWRLNFVAGAMAQTLRFWGQELGPIVGTLCDTNTSDPEGAIARLVSFGAAGFRAPLIGGEKHE
jgi:AcrR family transcriptional regulator